MSEHIKPEHSLALMALSADDPERMAAERHAQTCPACRALLREGELMLGWIDQSMATAPVNVALKNKIRQVVHEPAAKPRELWAKLLLWLGLTASVVFALLDGHAGELRPALGLECMLFENVVAVAPFAVAAWLAKRGSIEQRPLNMAVVSMAGALAGQVILHFRCESSASSHLFTFHVLGVALAAFLGYVASKRFFTTSPANLTS